MNLAYLVTELAVGLVSFLSLNLYLCSATFLGIIYYKLHIPRQSWQAVFSIKEPYPSPSSGPALIGPLSSVEWVLLVPISLGKPNSWLPVSGLASALLVILHLYSLSLPRDIYIIFWASYTLLINIFGMFIYCVLGKFTAPSLREAFLIFQSQFLIFKVGIIAPTS